MDKNKYISVFLPEDWMVADYPQKRLFYYKLGKGCDKYSGFGFSMPMSLVTRSAIEKKDKLILKEGRTIKLKKGTAEIYMTAQEFVEKFKNAAAEQKETVFTQEPVVDVFKTDKPVTTASATERFDTGEQYSWPLQILTRPFKEYPSFEDTDTDFGGKIYETQLDNHYIIARDNDMIFSTNDPDSIELTENAVKTRIESVKRGETVIFDELDAAIRTLIGGISKRQETLSEEDKTNIEIQYQSEFDSRDRMYWDTIPTKEEFVKEYLRKKNWAKYENFKNDFLYEKNTPLALRLNKQFICWKFEYYDKDGMPRPKPAKVPYQPNGRRSQSNNRLTWVNFETACKGVHEDPQMKGVGIMFTRSLIGIDIDGCIDKEGNIKPFARELVESINSYTEVSPSGTGIHILTFGKLPMKGTRNDKIGLEIYGEGRFFTLTGSLYEGKFRQLKKIQDAQPAIDKMMEQYFPNWQGLQNAINVPTEITYDDNKLIGKIEKGKKMGGQFERLRQGLAPYLWNKEDQTPTNKIDDRFIKPDGDVDRSRVDEAFCKILVFYGATPEQIDRIYQSEPLSEGRITKWNRRMGNNGTYGTYVINRAFNGVSKTYDTKFAYEQKKTVNNNVTSIKDNIME